MAVRLLDKFHTRHPALRAEFVMTEEFFDLAQGEVELAIWQGAPQDRTLVVRRIADVPWAVFASRAYIAAHGRPTPEAIAAHRLVEFAGPMKGHAAAVWMRSVAPRARIAARGNSVSEIMEAIRSGVGIGPLPIPHAKRENDLVMVADSRPELNFPFYVVIHRDMQRVRRVRAFLNFLAGEQKLVRRALEVGVA
jgi:DNA-binding transcriptional LysR family regulator